MYWDFASLRPETSFLILMVNSDIGIPNGYRHMNGFGIHTFRLVNSKGNVVYCKFHLIVSIKTLEM
jgi:catalase